MTIVVVGSLNMDLVARSPRHPRPGETVMGSTFNTFPGGKGANQAVAAARLGGQVVMVGKVGNDGFGASLLQTVAQDGVDTTYLRRDESAPTGVALIVVDANGQNSIVVIPGANGHLTVEDIDRARPALATARVLVVQLESPLDAVGRAIVLAGELGLQVVLNPAPAQKLPPELLAGVDYLVPNQSEMEALTGLTDPEAAVQALLALGVRNVVVTLGSHGCLVVEGGRKRRLPPFQVPVVDSTAAGDAFIGAFAVALTEGMSPVEAARWGTAAGALAVTRSGAQPSLPDRGEFEAFLKSSS